MSIVVTIVTASTSSPGAIAISNAQLFFLRFTVALGHIHLSRQDKKNVALFLSYIQKVFQLRSN